MAVIIAQHEPGDTVDDVVETGDDQDAVEHAVTEEPPGARREHGTAERIHAELDPLPLETEGGRKDQRRDTTQNGHEASAAEEGEVRRQIDAIKAVVERAPQKAAENAGRHRQSLELILLECLDGETLCLPGERHRARRAA